MIMEYNESALLMVVVPVLALLLSQPVRVQGATVARSMVSAPHLASTTAEVSSSLVRVLSGIADGLISTRYCHTSQTDLCVRHRGSAAHSTGQCILYLSVSCNVTDSNSALHNVCIYFINRLHSTYYVSIYFYLHHSSEKMKA